MGIQKNVDNIIKKELEKQNPEKKAEEIVAINSQQSKIDELLQRTNKEER